jgi:hypothetical protein
MRSQYTNVAEWNARRRGAGYLKTAAASVAVGLLAVPQILVCITHASFLTFAPEQIAYRYFLVARLMAGEGGNVWQPQGQLTSSVVNGTLHVCLPQPASK